ncbi:alpha amylase catalytic region [Caldicellulosiruptor kronotskyensis 2002]|uniref:Alpha amylase catalytic region n=1 Tax=Caldicellulosiruptor kronotskyensis (strain DSM 18902 / VKM B-2412 / 2002) TaxID=632348 RepID=E4SGZ0_CALK2|nr:alpha-amylase domain-containing protein [Caldicellulosiruptor kronotskyensis]ADQ47015.1 alpha amylase catalytic region [Caldicellulosiruptor kronotskyensis 2002]
MNGLFKKLSKKLTIISLIVIIVFLLTSSLSIYAGVMMQGFYWDVPAGGTWWNTLASKAYELKYMVGGSYGINRIWFPPAYKGQGGAYSMGYDPHDYYDLGQYYQDGTTETRFGSQSELKNAISKYKSYGISVTEDIVLNHRSGGKSEYNPKTGTNTWTDFTNTASGMCQWHWDAFHPNNYCSGDEGTFAGFPDVCYTSGPAYNDMKAWMNWLKSSTNAGFDSWRYDYVKGYGYWVVKDFNAATSPTFSVGEYWDANTSTLDWWANSSGSSVFDFALYYTLRDICNNTSGSGYLPNVFDYSKSYAAKNPFKAVTFVANHDTDEIVNDKMMAYAFILTYQGYPCIFWKDYYDYGLATGGGASPGGWGNGIKQLVWCREKLAAGAPNIEILKSNDGDIIIYGSKGYSTSSPGYIVVINDHPSQWKGAWVQTSNSYLKGKTLKAYAWSSTVSGQNVQPQNKYCDANGWVEVWAPPRGYAVYSVDGL